MGIQVITSFLIYTVISAFTPGPGNILALNTMVNHGWKKGKPLFLGIFFGYFFVQTFCAILIFSLDNLISPLTTILKYVGGVYILWLAYQVIISKPGNDHSDHQPSFFTGFILQIVNVKILLLGITALTGYIVPYYDSLDALLFFVTIISITGSAATLAWILFGKVFQNFYFKHFKVINIILGIILVQCAIALFI